MDDVFINDKRDRFVVKRSQTVDKVNRMVRQTLQDEAQGFANEGVYRGVHDRVLRFLQ